MPQHYALTIADQRQATPQLRWLTLQAPELARNARPGQYLLVRCSEPESYDPLLRRPLFIAAAQEALGQIGLLYAPAERGLAWLARGRPGDQVDVVGAFGQPFAPDRRTRTLLLVGQGPGLAALLLLAAQAAARGWSVALLAGATHPELLPPPFLLPSDVEYQSTIGPVTALLASPAAAPSGAPRTKGRRDPAPADAPPALSSAHLITWADQIVAALPPAQIPALREAVRAGRLRWERGFASVLPEGPLICGVGACGACTIETRHGQRTLCSDGPVFDLRDVGREAA